MKPIWPFDSVTWSIRLLEVVIRRWWTVAIKWWTWSWNMFGPVVNILLERSDHKFFCSHLPLKCVLNVSPVTTCDVISLPVCEGQNTFLPSLPRVYSYVHCHCLGQCSCVSIQGPHPSLGPGLQSQRWLGCILCRLHRLLSKPKSNLAVLVPHSQPLPSNKATDEKVLWLSKNTEKMLAVGLSTFKKNSSDVFALLAAAITSFEIQLVTETKCIMG